MRTSPTTGTQTWTVGDIFAWVGLDTAFRSQVMLALRNRLSVVGRLLVDSVATAITYNQRFETIFAEQVLVVTVRRMHTGRQELYYRGAMKYGRIVFCAFEVSRC